MTARGNNRQAVFDAISGNGGAATSQELGALCRYLHPRSIACAVDSLRRGGVVVKTGRGITARYQIAPGACRPDDLRGKKRGG